MGNLNVRVDRRQRERFKKRCKSQGLSIEFVISQLLQKVISGEIAFEQKIRVKEIRKG